MTGVAGAGHADLAMGPDASTGDLFGPTQERIRVGNPNDGSILKISPFRYPGGKSWLAPAVTAWLRGMARRPALFVEPFAGGASVSLNVAAAGVVERVLMVELDRDVAAVWEVALGRDDAAFEDLCLRIRRFEVDRETVLACVAATPTSSVDVAFRTILRNRTNRGGILAARGGMTRGGEAGRGLGSRWYPTTLIRRLRGVRALRGRIDFRQGDAFDVLAEHAGRRDAAFFVDPPYTAGGSKVGARLYPHSDLDHPSLFALVGRMAGPALMTYDDLPEVEALAGGQGFAVSRIGMRGSQGTAKRELLLSKPGAA